MDFHHVAISVRNLKDSQDFYEKLGFKQVHRWDADDNSLAIVHLKLGSVVLEIFAYTVNRNKGKLDLAVANDLEQIGVKHMSLHAADIKGMFNSMQQAGYKIGSSEIKHGRTGIDYFFIQDPDGVWVEIVQDDRGY